MNKLVSLKHLISQGEGRNLEFKTSFGREAIETIAAFANSKGGGVLLIGVDDGIVTGANSPPLKCSILYQSD